MLPACQNSQYHEDNDKPRCTSVQPMTFNEGRTQIRAVRQRLAFVSSAKHKLGATDW